MALHMQSQLPRTPPPPHPRHDPRHAMLCRYMRASSAALCTTAPSCHARAHTLPSILAFWGWERAITNGTAAYLECHAPLDILAHPFRSRAALLLHFVGRFARSSIPARALALVHPCALIDASDHYPQAAARAARGALVEHVPDAEARSRSQRRLRVSSPPCMHTPADRGGASAASCLVSPKCA
eukprot:1800014-Pleurochrysis_carterae.AAC.1